MSNNTTHQINTQVAVIGASLGGVLAAYQAAKLGVKTVLVSEFSWLGGQLTAQGVPVDEHKYIEQCGASKSYTQFRQAIREHYMQTPDFVDNSVMTEGLNPGDGWVSRLCFEPQLAEQYLRDLLAPYIKSKVLTLIEHSRPVSTQRQQRHIRSVTICDEHNQDTNIQADFFLDATDTGELLAQAKLPYRVGKESSDEFNERHAPKVANPQDQQPVTYVFALRKSSNNKQKIAKPDNYQNWLDYQLPGYNYPLFSEFIPGSEPYSKVQLPLFGKGDTLDLWRYRRVVASHNWHNKRDEVSLINWAQNDYPLAPLVDANQATMAQVSAAAKELSRCFVYWLQNDAPRSSVGESGTGFSELSLATDILGTDDGFAQQVYVRESRRIKGMETLSQSDIETRYPEDTVPVTFRNSVAIGLYNMDIHPTCDSFMGCNATVRPFELPLGVFVAKDIDNLLPACKNISVTHLVNAATRVHPIEWVIGEVAANIARYCLSQQITIQQVYHSTHHTEQLQLQLEQQGIPLHWPEQFSTLSDTQEH